MKDNQMNNKIEEVMSSAMKNLRTLVDIDVVVESQFKVNRL